MRTLKRQETEARSAEAMEQGDGVRTPPRGYMSGSNAHCGQSSAFATPLFPMFNPAFDEKVPLPHVVSIFIALYYIHSVRCLTKDSKDARDIEEVTQMCWSLAMCISAS